MLLQLKNTKDPAPALEKTMDAVGEKKTKGAAVEKKKTREKKDKKGTAKNTKAPCKPPRPAKALYKYQAGISSAPTAHSTNI